MASNSKAKKKYLSNWIVFPVGVVLTVPYIIWQNLPSAIISIFGFAIAVSAVIAGAVNYLRSRSEKRKGDHRAKDAHAEPDRHSTKANSTWVVVLAVIAICISLASAGFSAFVYTTMPQNIDSYVQRHKSELKGEKGEKGDTGPQGAQGYQGATGSSGYGGSVHCSTYDGLLGSDTYCY